MRRYSYLTLLLLVALSACQLVEPVPDTVPDTVSRIQIKNWRGTAATVTAQVYGDAGTVVAATGTVSAAGELTFKLEPVPAAQLSNFAACPGVTVSDTALKLGSFSTLEVVRDNVSVGRISHTSSLEIVTNGLRQAGDYYVQYTYADRDASVSGRCQGSGPATFSYALTLNKGWNPVVFRLIKDGVLELSTEPVPAGAAWFFSEAKQ